MNIRDFNTGSLRPDQLRSGSTSKADQKAAHTAPTPSEASRSTEDRVEISDAARAAHANNPRRTQEIDQARQALQNIPSMSEERAANILQRIEEGYYSQPDTIRKVAEAMMKDLQGDSPV